MRTLLVTLTTCLLVLPAYAKYSGGSGTAQDPYQIATAADLIALGNEPNDYAKHFILTADIDLAPNLPGGKVFDKAVIGSDQPGFTGVFDGNGRMILHLTIQGGGFLGLFGELRIGAEVKNLIVSDVNVSGSGWGVGGLIGSNSGSVTRCRTVGVVKGTKSNVGGLLGYNNNTGHVTECYSAGIVSSDDIRTGGLIGYNDGAVTQCCSAATTTSAGYVGGLVGENMGTLSQCYSTGIVTAVGTLANGRVGGLVGGTWTSVTQCYSTGKVTGLGTVGGLVGASFIGRGGVPATACFWDMQTSGQASSSGGTGKTTAEMKMAATFAAWDFEGTWTIQEGVDYPRLQWEGKGVPSPVPATIEKVSGDSQCGTAGSRLASPLTVRVKDQNDVAMPNVQVDFLITAGDGMVEPSSAMTDTHGIASTDLTLGPTPGLNQVRATAGNLSVSFNITGLAPGYGGGTGEHNDPYQIWTAEQMNSIGAEPNDWGKHFKLMGDIDLSGFDGKQGRPAFNIIGRLTGVFDGSGHILSHLTIKGGGHLGLFGELRTGAEVKNLGVADVNVAGSDDYVGGLVGSNGGALTGCYSTGVVGGREDVGGLVGDNWGPVAQCYSVCGVTGNNGVGGLMGENSDGTVSNCYSTGAVRGPGRNGGLMGYNGGAVMHCFWDTQTSGQATSAGGTGKTTAEMKTARTFLDAGWDFVGETANGSDDIWKMSEGSGYPRLGWEKYSGGTGEPNDPYQITTAADLILLGTSPGDCGRHFILTADIDLDPNLPGGKVFDKAIIAPSIGEAPNEPQGSFYGTAFTGVFDGSGHTLSHLAINGSCQLGLFGNLGPGAKVKDLGIVDVNIVGAGYIGALAGENWGAVTHCYSTGVVSGFWWRAAGLIGLNHAGVTQCYTTCAVSGTDYTGGLVGENAGLLRECYSTSAVTGMFFGIGGLVGLNQEGTVTRCYSTGAVSGQEYVGGLVGWNSWGGAVSYSYSTGTARGSKRVGGLVGNNTGSVSFSFWDTQTSGQASSSGGTGKTTAEMQTASTFLEAGWDFVGETANGTEDIWWINEGRDYPRLWWELPAEK